MATHTTTQPALTSDARPTPARHQLRDGAIQGTAVAGQDVAAGRETAVGEFTDLLAEQREAVSGLSVTQAGRSDFHRMPFVIDEKTRTRTVDENVSTILLDELASTPLWDQLRHHTEPPAGNPARPEPRSAT
ncbi:hypothetical protein ACIQ9Q_40445 [Streptomyces sp. NPDC094438]|uniref:hypothetical protein n=1 Tax=Streptomyces sp. NPDC094438 TaxID=3366061 RepID=UPI0037F8BD78